MHREKNISADGSLRSDGCQSSDEQFIPFVEGQAEKRPADARPAHPGLLRARPHLLLAQPAYQEILESLTWPPETCGLLLGPCQQDHVVTHFHFDRGGQGTPGSFTLDHAGLNGVLKSYAAARLDCKGYVHAHPPGFDSLSYGDFTAVRAIFGKEKNRSLQQFFMPIVIGRQLRPYVVFRADLEAGLDFAHLMQLILF
jgi:proteasome lid subunit RPN8/RPN11